MAGSTIVFAVEAVAGDDSASDAADCFFGGSISIAIGIDWIDCKFLYH